MSVAALSSLRMTDFGGGLNLLDEPNPNQAIDIMNVRIDRLGRIEKRLGYAKDGGMAAFAADIVGAFFWPTIADIVVQEGVNVRKRTAPGTFTLVKAFSTNDPVRFAEFNGKLLMLHPVDGLFTATVANALAGPFGGFTGTIQAKSLAVWQNKVWVGQAPNSANPPRLHFCVAGNETDWAGAGSGTVDIREVNDDALVALAVSPRLGLVAAKRGASYRVYDSTTGAYTTIDPTTGVETAASLCALDDRVVAANRYGIYVSDGVSEFQRISRPLDPLWNPQVFGTGQLDLRISVSPEPNKVLISWPFTTPDLTFEIDVVTGAYNVRSPAAIDFVFKPNQGTNEAYFAGRGSSRRFLYKDWTGGSDDGAAIAAWYQTPWIPLAGLHPARVQQVLVNARGAFNIFLRTDRATSGGVQMSPAGSATALAYATYWPRKLAREVSFRVEENSSLTGSEPNREGVAGNLTLGAFALHELAVDFSALGRV